MGTKKNSKWSDTSGLLSLEASIALTMFLFLMLFIFSFLVIFEARNQMAHVMLTTADSLAIDAFANEAPQEDTLQEIMYGLYGSTTDSEGTYTDSSKWYAGDEAALQETIKDRFVAYLAGGDTEEADKILRSLNIVDGLDGVDFSSSHVTDGELFLVIEYKIEYEFQVFGLDGLELRQSCCSKLWK